MCLSSVKNNRNPLPAAYNLFEIFDRSEKDLMYFTRQCLGHCGNGLLNVLDMAVICGICQVAIECYSA